MWSTETSSCNNLYNHGKQSTITREVDQLPIPKISVVLAVVMYLLASFNREQECQTVVLKQDRSVHIDIALCLCGSLIFRLFGRVCPKQVHVHVVFGLFWRTSNIYMIINLLINIYIMLKSGFVHKYVDSGWHFPSAKAAKKIWVKFFVRFAELSPQIWTGNNDINTAFQALALEYPISTTPFGTKLVNLSLKVLDLITASDMTYNGDLMKKIWNWKNNINAAVQIIPVNSGSV